MQESRRRRRLELGVVCLGLAFGGCGSVGSRRIASTPATERHTSETPATSAARSPSVAASNGASSSAAAVSDPLEESSTAPLRGEFPKTTPDLPRGTVVLHVGDSFAGALGVALGKRLKAAGLRSVLQFKTSSYIPTWAWGQELPRYVATFNPDLVLVTLGANELDIPDPKQRIAAIQRLVSKIGQRPCVWISPPLWKPDTRLMQVIRAHAAPCHFLDSDSLVHDLPRMRDHIHPSPEGREIWAAAVFEWLQQAREPAGDKPWALRGDLEAPEPRAALLP
jgi:lysophospholipase L1-like esterase